MKIIQKPRAGGKTFEIVKSFREHGHGILVIACGPERERICRLYNFTEAERQRTIIAGPDRLRGYHGEVFCDNLDWVVSIYLGGAVDVAAVNG